MQYSIVGFNNILKMNGAFRLDSEYYLPKYLTLLNSISKNFININDISYITDGEHGNPDYDLQTNIKYITVENIRENFILETEFKTISETQHNRNKRSQLQEDDLLVYSVGDRGYVAPAEKHLFPANIPRSVAIIRLKDKRVDAKYLSTFLNSKYGSFQIERLQAGNVQPVLSLNNIKKINICVLKEEFQHQIANLVNESYKLREQAKTDYNTATNILEVELGIKNWRPKNHKTNIKRLSEVKETSGTFRIYAEYFQPKYEDIINKIKAYKHGCKPLAAVVAIKKSIEVGSNAYTKNGIPYIRISNLTENGLNYTNCNYISKEYYHELKHNYQPNKNDILFSKDGTIGIAYKYNSNDKIILSGGILRLFNSSINENALTLLLNSILVKQQTERLTGGALIAHLSIDNVKSLLIPNIPANIQQEISLLVEAFFNKKAKAKQLLEIARRGVEIAIEQNEEVATAWINQELKSKK